MVTMSNVWDRTTEFLGDNRGSVVPLALAAIFIPVSIQGCIAELGKTPGEVLARGLFSLALSLISYWGQLAIIALTMNPDADRAAATRQATARLPAAIGIGLVLFVAFLLLFSPAPIALALAGFDFSAAINGGHPSMPVSVTGFVLFYLLAAGLVFLWLMARLVLVNPIIVGERRGLGVFARSFALTRGLTWRIIGVILLFGIVAMVSVLAAKTVFGSILRLLLGDDGTVNAASVLTAILVAIVSTIFTVLAAAFTAELYVAVRDPRATIVETRQ